MVINTMRTPRKNRRKDLRHGKQNRIAKRPSPRSPQSMLVQSRLNKSGRGRGRGGAGGGSLATSGLTKPNSTGRRTGPWAWKYSNPALKLPPSIEPFEKNCFEKSPIIADYTFVPRGDVYVTRNCRSKTKETQRIVYKVYDDTGKRALGIRVPSDVYAAVTQSAAETAKSRAKAVELRDEKDAARSRQLLRNQYPLMPADSLNTIIDHAFLKGSGRVGRTSTTTDERKALLAVEAHIRHTHTPYEDLLKAGKGRDEARKAVWGVVQAVRKAWEGHGMQPASHLTLRSRAVE